MGYEIPTCQMQQKNLQIKSRLPTPKSLEGTFLENNENIKYLGVTITNDLKWNTHIRNICTKANPWILEANSVLLPSRCEKAAYKGMVRPVVEYESSFWDPHTNELQDELEKVQNRAARCSTKNYVYKTGSMTGILGQLEWASLKKRRKDNK